MGVKSCSRTNCDEIMCYTYVPTIGYLCFDCQEEFKEYLEGVHANPKTEGDIKQHLRYFMASYKGTYSASSEITVDEFFKNNTER